MSIKDPLCHDHKRWLKNAEYLYLIPIFFKSVIVQSLTS